MWHIELKKSGNSSSSSESAAQILFPLCAVRQSVLAAAAYLPVQKNNVKLLSSNTLVEGESRPQFNET